MIGVSALRPEAVLRPPLRVRRAVLLLAVAAVVLLPATRAEDPVPRDKPKDPIDPKVVEVLKSMGTFVGDLKQFSVEADETFEDLLEGGEKVQFSNRRNILIARPNRAMGTVEGDSANNAFFYDGKGLNVLDRDKNTYFTLPLEGPLDKMLDEAHERYGLQFPLADLMFPKPDKVLLEKVKSALYLGQHQVAGVKCHHIACTQNAVDWQLWVEAGDKPWPRKLVITHKKEEGAPQYQAFLHHWKDKPEIKDDTFQFVPPKDAKKIEIPESPARPK